MFVGAMPTKAKLEHYWVPWQQFDPRGGALMLPVGVDDPM